MGKGDWKGWRCELEWGVARDEGWDMRYEVGSATDDHVDSSGMNE